MFFLRTIFRPKVTDQREVNAYVVTVTAFALVCFLAVDIPNHLLFFTRWSDYWRDWSIDVVIGVAVAVPVLRSIGGAHLALYLAEREAERLSRTDPLTDLANRRALYHAAERVREAPIILVIADIDRFKRINDTYGHAGGDKVIQFIAATLNDELGDLGTVARVGGEEFALLCADRALDVIRARIERVRHRLAQTHALFDEHAISASLSFGVSTGVGANFNDLYLCADKALYIAKASGRDKMVEYDEIEEIALNDASLSLRRAG